MMAHILDLFYGVERSMIGYVSGLGKPCLRVKIVIYVIIHVHRYLVFIKHPYMLEDISSSEKPYVCVKSSTYTN